MRSVAFIVILALASTCLGQGFVCAEGGGNPGKGAWADEVFGWMVEKGKKGDAVIIGAVPLDEPDNRIDLFKKLGAKSCVGLVIDEKNADTQEIYDQVAAASIVFIRGGAQERYVNWWKGTKTEKAIHAVFDKGGVIAGTSAGCAILGEVSYDSKNGSLKPTEALEDACHKHLTLTTEFLGLVPGVLFDTHFTERGRIARLPVMLAHCRDELHKDVIGIGMDPRTAFCVEPDGTATVRGEGTATLLQLTPGSRTEIQPGKPPVITSIAYTRVPARAKYDLKKREFIGADLPARPIEAASGFADMVFDGASTAGVAPAKFDPAEVPAADDTTTPRAGPTPRWQDAPQPTHLCIASNSWSKPRPVMEDVRDRVCLGWCAVLLDPGNRANLSSQGVLTMASGSSPARSVVVIDPSTIRRQLPLERSTLDARMHVLPPGWKINLATGEVIRPAPVQPAAK
jgi:cyanophycinase